MSCAFIDVVPVLSDLDTFRQDHSAHGSLMATAAEPAWNGYPLTVGAVGDRLKKPTGKLARLASLN